MPKSLYAGKILLDYSGCVSGLVLSKENTSIISLALIWEASQAGMDTLAPVPDNICMDEVIRWVRKVHGMVKRAKGFSKKKPAPVVVEEKEGSEFKDDAKKEDDDEKVSLCVGV